jgi:hypothetical protein
VAVKSFLYIATQIARIVGGSGFLLCKTVILPQRRRVFLAAGAIVITQAFVAQAAVKNF